MDEMMRRGSKFRGYVKELILGRKTLDIRKSCLKLIISMAISLKTTMSTKPTTVMKTKILGTRGRTVTKRKSMVTASIPIPMLKITINLGSMMHRSNKAVIGKKSNGRKKKKKLEGKMKWRR